MRATAWLPLGGQTLKDLKYRRALMRPEVGGEADSVAPAQLPTAWVRRA
ncbi:hypothetical protein [Mycobacterium haemophilum]